MGFSVEMKCCSALTPNHFLQQRATQLPPGVFGNQYLFSRKRKKVKFLVDHYVLQEVPWIREYKLFREDRNGSTQDEMCRLVNYWYF